VVAALRDRRLPMRLEYAVSESWAANGGSVRVAIQTQDPSAVERSFTYSSKQDGRIAV